MMAASRQVAGDEGPRRSWWSRNWLWFVPTVLLMAFLISAACCGGVLLTPYMMLRSSQPYEMALSEVQEDPAVVERLGEPIKADSWFPVGTVHAENGGGEAALDFDVAGPDGRAHVRTQAKRIDGQWGLARLEVTFDDGRRLSLDTGSGDGLEEAPLWTPP